MLRIGLTGGLASGKSFVGRALADLGCLLIEADALGRQVLEQGTLTKGTTYVAGVRMRLDISQLPKPFQLNALASRDWNFGSEWHRWSVTP